MITWKNEIQNTLNSLGDKATLKEIYNHIEKNTDRKLAKTWQATVRQTLQSHCSEMKTKQVGENLFVKLNKGKWGLKDEI